MSARQKRLKAELTLGSVACLAFVVGVVAWMGAAEVSLESNATLAALWWGCLIVGSALGVGACRIDEDSDDTLSSVVAGIRREWRHESIHH